MLAVYTGADLHADGIGPLPCAAPVQNRDGTPHARPAAPGAGATARCAMSAIRWPSSSPKRSKQARDAAELVAVDYELLPSVTDLATAMEPGAPLVWPEVTNNISFDWEIGDKAATDAAVRRGARMSRG